MTDEFDKLKHSFRKRALKERDYERTRNKRYENELHDLHVAHVSVLTRISKLKDDVTAAIEFGDLTESFSTEMILEFCDDVVKLTK
tara:strand:+ start:437 stop:694 length:258 start_codon:yes stop_codon:yes gene_type:complete